MANADVYTVQYAAFIQTFARVAGLAPLERYFFIEGGALAVENALKAAMDWKVRRNLAAGLGERGTEIIHFERAFHGRSGYTMSLTNTDPRKIAYFAKFPWPRIIAPNLDFSLPPAQREAACRKGEAGTGANPGRSGPEGSGDCRHYYRAHPGRGRRQSFPGRVSARATPDL